MYAFMCEKKKKSPKLEFYGQALNVEQCVNVYVSPLVLLFKGRI